MSPHLLQRLFLSFSLCEFWEICPGTCPNLLFYFFAILSVEEATGPSCKGVAGVSIVKV